MNEINMGLYLPNLELYMLWATAELNSGKTKEELPPHKPYIETPDADKLKSFNWLIQNGFLCYNLNGVLHITEKGAYAVAGYDPQDELQGR